MRPTQICWFRRPAARVLEGIARDNAQALSAGINIVRGVLKQSPNPLGWTTHDLYTLALQVPPPPAYPSWTEYGASPSKKLANPPPHPEHPIRSKVFMKHILSHLEGDKEIKRVRELRIPTNPVPSKKTKGKQKQKENAEPTPIPVFVWKAVDKSTLPAPSEPKPMKKPFGIEVGVGQDVSHLNKRRQRARVGKISRMVQKMAAFSAVTKDSTTNTHAS